MGGTQSGSVSMRGHQWPSVGSTECLGGAKFLDDGRDGDRVGGGRDAADEKTGPERPRGGCEREEQGARDECRDYHRGEGEHPDLEHLLSKDANVKPKACGLEEETGKEDEK